MILGIGWVRCRETLIFFQLKNQNIVIVIATVRHFGAIERI